MNPDSALDKIKITQLKNTLNKGMRPEAKQSKVPAMLGSFAAILLVGSLGGIVATLNPRPAAAAEKPPQVASDTSVTNEVPFKPAQEKPNPNEKLAANDVQPVNNEGDPVVETDDSQPSPFNPGARRVARRDPEPANRWQSRAKTGNRTLPDPSGNGNVVDTNDPTPDAGTTPVKLDGIKIEPTPRQNSGQDPNEPTPEGGNRNTSAENNQNNGAPKPIMNITVKKRGTGNLGGGESVDKDPSGMEATFRAGKEQHQAGRYDGAAKAYEKTRQMGNDSGAVNQKLGQVYDRLGKKNDAISAYQRSISRYEKEARDGKPGAKQALDAAKQALKNLQGG